MQTWFLLFIRGGSIWKLHGRVLEQISSLVVVGASFWELPILFMMGINKYDKMIMIYTHVIGMLQIMFLSFFREIFFLLGDRWNGMRYCVSTDFLYMEVSVYIKEFDSDENMLFFILMEVLLLRWTIHLKVVQWKINVIKM